MIEEILCRFDLYMTAFQPFADLTRMAYFSDVSQFCNYLQMSGMPLFSLTAYILKDYVKHMYELGLKGRTRARKIHSLKVFLEYLHEHEKFPKDLTSHLVSPSYEKPLPEILTQKEIKILLSAADKYRDKYKERNRMLIYLLYTTGMRISEAVKLKVTDLHLDQNLVCVMGKGSKERMIPLPSKITQMLYAYIKECDQYLFASSHEDKMKPLCRQSAMRIIKRIWKKTKIKKNIYPHILRHSYASHMLQNGANIRQIQMLLGHESLSSTQMYTSIDLEYIKPVYHKKHVRS